MKKAILLTIWCTILVACKTTSFPNYDGSSKKEDKPERGSVDDDQTSHKDARPSEDPEDFDEYASLQDGHCRPFDDDATGTIFTDGIGVVLLKDYETAVEDGDQIYGVIEGVGTSNDGGDKASYSAPSIEGQVSCIEEALEDAGIEGPEISYVEAHGTGTKIGSGVDTTWSNSSHPS